MSRTKTKVTNAFLTLAPWLPLRSLVITAALLQKLPGISAQTWGKLGNILVMRGATRPAGDAFWTALVKDPDHGERSWWLRTPHIRKDANTPQRVQQLSQIVANHPEADVAAITLSIWQAANGDLKEATAVNKLTARRKFAKFHKSAADFAVEPLIPQFLIIGLQKCGTSALHAYLSQHPGVAGPILKEINYWSRNFELGWDWYLSHFPLADAARFITGEASPGYVFNRLSPLRIHEKLPATRLILLIRNPVDQAYSLYQMWYHRGLVSASFPEMVRREMELAPDCGLDLNFLFEHTQTLILRNIALPFIKYWRDIFPKEQLMIVQSEELRADPNTKVNEVYSFLGLPAYQSQNYPQVNSGRYEPLPLEMRKMLERYFDSYRLALENYLERPLGWW